MPEATVRGKDESTREAAARMTGNVLVAAGAWAGLDTPMRWRHVVMPKAPYGAPTILDNKEVSRYADSVPVKGKPKTDMVSPRATLRGVLRLATAPRIPKTRSRARSIDASALTTLAALLPSGVTTDSFLHPEMTW